MRLPRHLTVLVALAALALLAGCGSQGNPLPPSLHLPQPVVDLKAARKGDKVFLTWTAPSQTTDGVRIKAAGVTRVCRATSPPADMQCAEVPAPPPPGQAAGYTDLLPEELQQRNPNGFAVYTVEVLNLRGRSAGQSNAIPVPVAPTLPAPSDAQAKVTAEAVVISFTPVPPKLPSAMFTVYRIYRHAKGTAGETVAGELPVSSADCCKFADTAFQWETTYDYRVTGVTLVLETGERLEVEGEDSAVVEVLVHDSFPPAAPSGVQAVATSGGGQIFVDLTWSPNSEADLTGYNVYRREGDGQPQKLNSEPVKTPAFRDSSVSAGHTYSYSVSAVDLRNNESGSSEETSETVPQP